MSDNVTILNFIGLLPTPLFLLTFHRRVKYGRHLLSILPRCTTIAATLATILVRFPPLSGCFTITKHLTNFFRCSGACTLFILVDLVYLVAGPVLGQCSCLYTTILVNNVLCSNDHAIVLLANIYIILLILFIPNKHAGLVFNNLFITVLIITIICTIIAGHFSSVNHFLQLSLSRDAFLNHLLCCGSTLNIVTARPFNLKCVNCRLDRRSFRAKFCTIRCMRGSLLRLLLSMN